MEIGNDGHGAPGLGEHRQVTRQLQPSVRRAVWGCEECTGRVRNPGVEVREVSLEEVTSSLRNKELEDLARQRREGSAN